MYGTNTKTNTYTVLDIRKTFESCEADIRTIARRTNKWTMEYVDQVFHDVLKFAEKYYLHSISIALINTATKVPIRATKFIVNDLGDANNSERAGKNNDWPDTSDTSLSIILTHTQEWLNLTPEEKINFQKELKISWGSTDINTNFPHLVQSDAQLYASNGYELQKKNFK
ncbi:HORMA-1 domain-containing protein [Elizabethkingia anophelis]|uniref:HORMA-1 domain-containing protein n=1 Tax=Elizabethkingia anophelis TaxID=1117645 RepID=UPI003891DA4E